MSVFRLAAAQYPIEEPATLAVHLAKLTDWCERAAADGAEILMFPEYAGAEAMACLGRAANRDLLGATAALQPLLPEIDAHLAGLSARLGVFILGGSAPVSTDGATCNVARFFGPGGGVGAQEKLILTPYDRGPWALTGGATQMLFDTPFGRIGVAICYDVEFPLVVRALTEAGAELILCPSCTDTLAGYWRVRLGAQARALESQCVVAQSPTVGAAAWTPALDVNRGAAGVYLPPDSATAADGVLTKGRLDAAEWLIADIDLAPLRALRETGEVRTHRDWAEQRPLPIAAIELA